MMNSTRRKRSPVQSSSMAMERTVVKSRGLQSIPSGVAVEIAFVLLRRPFGISEPHGCVAHGARGHRPGKRIHFALLRDKCKKKADARNRLDVPMDVHHGQARELRFKALRRMQNEDLLLILEVEFFKYFGHGFL